MCRRGGRGVVLGKRVVTRSHTDCHSTLSVIDSKRWGVGPSHQNTSGSTSDFKVPEGHPLRPAPTCLSLATIQNSRAVSDRQFSYHTRPCQAAQQLAIERVERRGTGEGWTSGADPPCPFWVPNCTLG